MTVTDRRTFICQLAAGAAGGALLARPASAAVPSIEATATVFYGHPGGQANLVRFVAFDVDAPAGRLRVYDGARRLLATAGMIRRGDGLYGELWLPLASGMTVATELEAPGLRGILRGRHRLEPKRRWTVHWVSVAAPSSLARALETLPPPNRAVAAATLAAAGVGANPLPDASGLALLDHLPFLRLSAAARRVEARLGIPASPLAVMATPEAYPPTTPLALAGAGGRYVALPWREDAPYAWWQAPDGSRLLAVAVPPGGDPRALGFAAGRSEMTQRLELWLLTLPPGLLPADGRPVGDGHVLVLDTEPADDAGGLLRAVRDWNARFAYPRIVIGAGEELVLAVERRRGDTIPVLGAFARAPVSRPPADELRAARDARDTSRRDRATALLTPLARLLAPAATTPNPEDALRLIARQIDAGAAGTVVFNPSPFPRTDLARLPGGAERVVTDVPAVGYVYVPDAFFAEDQGAPPEEGPTTIEDAHHRLALDAASGAVQSLVTRSDGREWVRQDGAGLNALPGAILENLRRERLPGVGTRLVASRFSPEHGAFRCTITSYDALPWIDIVNETAAAGAGAGAGPIPWEFRFAMDAPRVRWEIPAGWDEAAAPVDGLLHLRWLALEAAAGTVLLSAPDAPFASVSGDGGVTAVAAPGRTRLRLQVGPGPIGPGDAARFGWGIDPFVTARVVATTRGSLPRVGALLVVDQPGVAMVGLKPADDGNGVIVYLQELLGAGRFVSVGAGLLGFRRARVVDYLERDTGEDAAPVTEGAFVSIRPNGVVALRLEDVRLRGP